MKRKLLLVLSFTLIFALMLTACQGNIEESSISVSETLSDTVKEPESKPESKAESETEVKEEEKLETSESLPESEVTDAEENTATENEAEEIDPLSTDITADIYLPVTNPEVTQVQYDENGVGYHSLPIVERNEVEFKNIGDTFKGWVKYEHDGHKVIHGNEGLYYTLDSVELYENISDAELDPNGKILYEDWHDTNMFILCEITVKYEAPAGGETTIISSVSELEGEHLEEINKESETEPIIPLVAYCSDLPKGDSELLLNSNQGFRFLINDGETITFQVGIIANKAFVESKNVFLRVNYVVPKYVADYRHKYFILFPEN